MSNKPLNVGLVGGERGAFIVHPRKGMRFGRRGQRSNPSALKAALSPSRSGSDQEWCTVRCNQLIHLIVTRLAGWP